MADLFGTTDMAAGYATARPPLHALIMDRIKAHLPFSGKVARALDVGCGAGLSTGALKGVANQRIGIEPVERMLNWRSTTAPGADFVAGRAEAIPVRNHSINLITAAGSLNYVDLTLFFQEALRILVPGGVIAVYDFSPGRAFSDSGSLGDWFSRFIARYPWAPDNAAHLDPDRLSGMRYGFRLQSSERFDIGVTLTPAFYVDYMMTETNVSFARRNGEPEGAIRSWVASTLGPVWGEQPQEVMFPGYFACLVDESRASGEFTT